VHAVRTRRPQQRCVCVSLMALMPFSHKRASPWNDIIVVESSAIYRAAVTCVVVDVVAATPGL